MLAEYNLPFPSSLSSLDEELDWLGTGDDLLQLDVNLVQVVSDDEDTNDMFYPTSNLNLFLRDDGDEEAAPAEGVGQPGVARAKVEGTFGSPGSDYFANAYLTALRDSEGIGGSEVLLGGGLLQSEADVQPRTELSDSDDSSAWSLLNGLTSSCPASPTAKRKKLCDLEWSEMDGEEQSRMLEVIADAIRECEGIREQLELLRIIGQDMTVLPTDSHFTIDPTNMDDAKLKSIHSYLSQMARHTLDCEAKSPKEFPHSKSPPRHKKPMERRSQHKTHRKRKTREKKQNQKERRSGLFDQEVVLALQIQDDDDREINILD